MKNGNEITFMTLIQDITENKQFEERLAQNDLSLREAQAIAHIGSWEINLLDKSEIWSDDLYQIRGVQKTAIPQRGLGMIFKFVQYFLL